MALIKCVECGKMISDKSDVCINCGCPTKISKYETTNTKCRINDKLYDFSHEFDVLLEYIKNDKMVLVTKTIREKTKLCLKDSNILCHYIKENGEFPREFKGTMSEIGYRTTTTPQPKCPKCGSTSIQIVPRKWSLLTGFATNKTDRVCVNCKYRW